jgi:hypothetical protein
MWATLFNKSNQLPILHRAFFQRNSNKAKKFNLPQLFKSAPIAKCSLCKSSADISAELTPKKISSCVIVDAGKAPTELLGTTLHDLF